MVSKLLNNGPGAFFFDKLGVDACKKLALTKLFELIATNWVEA
jgi:hypothetical protein